MKPLNSPEENNKYKIITLGDAGAGKTSLVLRYTRNVFDPNLSTTIGANFVTVPVDYNHQDIELELWDTAGQERYRSVLPLYSQGSSAILLVFDASSDNYLKNVQYWVDYIVDKMELTVPVYLIGNKNDLVDCQDEIVASTEEIVERHSLKLFFTSAKTGQNVERLFRAVTEDVVRRENRTTKVTKTMILSPQKQESKPCCG
ncbi:Ras-related protein RABE1e [Tritrichomonas foetus]|uniref:Ras-related protein RABE1e n=1 Tax=Tritrichomonas foetus TaxID=1144522 RepID=A0A1J4KEA0_9EUKA|nr:Ras-related protein RABE1e [Tritrichomonas foetus]|eukprot:OHT09240.1 Ras-related protein RABE1e [Tritrichomonas foetus]